jgi:anthranilate phosphoribosyltransferase
MANTDPIAFSTAFSELTRPSGLSQETAESAFDAILTGSWLPTQMAAFLGALQVRDLSVLVLTSAARSMRRAMVPVEHNLPIVIDTCGTGGDGQRTLNLSTAAALIVAAAGIPVAKHGNRAVSSQAGSADVIEKLGISLDMPAKDSGELLRTVGIAFLMAPQHHPAMRFAAPVRRELGVRTIFNCLGPLANPASATHQLLGAFSDLTRNLLAETLRELGSVRAWVVHSHDGLDEISPFGKTAVSELRSGNVTNFEIAPEDFGLKPSPKGAIAGADAAHNAAILTSILQGVPHPATDAIILNAAAALVLTRDLSPKAAAAYASELLSQLKVRDKLKEWQVAAERLHATRL